MPSWASHVRKRVWAQFIEFKNVCSSLFIDHRALWFKILTKSKNDKDCQHSKSAPALILWRWPNGMIRVLSFLLLGMVLSTLVLVFRMPPYVGFTATLDLRLRFAFASLSCLSMLFFHFGKTTNSQTLSCVLVPANLSIQLRWGYRWPLLWFWRCGV
jgi:hypothetical protein